MTLGAPMTAVGRSATRAADRRGVITRQFAPPFQERHPLRSRDTVLYSRAWNGRVATARHAGSWSVYISASLSFAVACACRSSLCPTLDKPKGKKRERLEAWFAGPEGPQSLFKGRILPFDEKAALVWARLMADGTVKGRPRSALDMVIAAVAEANGCVVVTDNERDFDGLKFVNP